MNELAVKSGYLRPLSDKDSSDLKKLLIEMYTDIARVCDDHGLVYMVSGGTCLGAVRHHGFIPWDDDFDMIMPRDSYDKFIGLLRMGVMGDAYEYDAPSKDHDCRNLYLKVFRRNTLNVELSSECTPGPTGIFIDIFPIENAPKYAFLQKLKGAISDAIATISVSVLYAKYPSNKYEEFMRLSKETYWRHKARLLIGKMFGIISHRQWVWWYEVFNKQSRFSGFWTIPTGRAHYFGEIHKVDVFVPTTEGSFDSVMVKLPANTDAYLKALYGDYMKIPPIEKRERHFVYQFSCDTNVK